MGEKSTIANILNVSTIGIIPRKLRKIQP